MTTKQSLDDFWAPLLLFLVDKSPKNCVFDASGNNRLNASAGRRVCVLCVHLAGRRPPATPKMPKAIDFFFFFFPVQENKQNFKEIFKRKQNISENASRAGINPRQNKSCSRRGQVDVHTHTHITHTRAYISRGLWDFDKAPLLQLLTN